MWDAASKVQHLSLDTDQLEALFQLLESKALQKSMKGVEEVRLIEHRRAHNLSIELSGIRKPFQEIRAALIVLDDSCLTVEQLLSLSRAVPDESERKELELYLCGEHPRYREMTDVTCLGTVERYFVEIKDIPRLGERISCLAFTRTFESTYEKCESQLGTLVHACHQLKMSNALLKVLQAVLELGNHLNAGTHRGGAVGFKLDTLLKLADVKGTDRKTSLLHFVLQQLLAIDPDISNLLHHLSEVSSASRIQLSAVRGQVGELRLGLRNIHNEVSAAAKTRNVEGSGSGRFIERMTPFYEGAVEQFNALEEKEKDVYRQMEELSKYFGEEYSAQDPLRVMKTLSDFLQLFDRALGMLKSEQEKKATAVKKDPPMRRSSNVVKTTVDKESENLKALRTPQAASSSDLSIASTAEGSEVFCTPETVGSKLGQV